ncbi:MAG: hypothetical protein AB7D36_10075 [Oscillospiraceae bacterium]
MKKIYVLMGNFGSGKTELALNIALEASKNGKTLLIDLDMVNTYFRLSDRKALIEAAEIRLISPNYACMNVETLSLPAEVVSAFHGDWDTVVFDAGGDPAGATALGRYHEDFSQLQPGQLSVLNVVNVRRPMSGTPEKIISILHDMERNSRLQVTGFINNTNLSTETTEEDLRDGYAVLKQVSEKTAIPVLYTSGKRHMLDRFLAEGHDRQFIGTPLVIDLYTHRDWDSFIKRGR